ncbi:hypothetical protein ASG11_09900 [Sphingomonas sp. Leaf357]|uniref:hypothetical protein n=1 Tax=Sphingomonas sp. Leaf357 TaxID=1736350 RepID=UPI0006FA2D8A|nr:hypothetical protein [Sphingomonas sp. Leaf357]KQS04523.1 hypothetical protein ASG11_09900 [Sphingomonas sp. Leaf357]
MTIHTTNTPERETEWKRLVGEYKTAIAVLNSVPASDDAAFDVAHNASGSALQALTKHPAPSLAALAEKCELILSEYPDADHLDRYDAFAVIADVRRLAAREA